MFFNKKPDIELDRELLKKNKVPILIKDSAWKTMASHFKDRKINSLSQELSQILKEEKQLEVEIQQMKKEKSAMTQHVLEMSYQLNQNNQYGSDKEMNKAKNGLQETTRKLESLYAKKEEMPSLIQEVNFQLLEATVANAASQLIHEDREHQKREKEIKILREELNRLREKKEEAEEKMYMYYHFLHSLLGPSQMEELDHQIHYKK